MEDPQPSISKIDDDISKHSNELLSLQIFHPSRPRHVQALALAYSNRYTLSGLTEDIDKSILRCTEAIFHPFPSDRSYRNIAQIFFFITETLVHRARQHNQSEDVKWCIAYLRYLQGLPLKTYGVPLSQVLSYLVEALAIHAELNPDITTVTQDAQEIVDLCRELLVYTQKDCRADPGTPLKVTSRREPIECVIESLREANRRLPDVHEISIALAWSLIVRFAATCLIHDYEEAAVILDRIIASRTPRDCPTSYRPPPASTLIPSLAHFWISQYGDPEGAEEGIRRFRVLLKNISPEHPLRPVIDTSLASLQERRSHDLGTTEGLADLRLSSSDVFRLPTKIPSFAKSNAPTTPENDQHVEVNDRTSNIANMEDAIKYFRMLCAESHPSGLISLFSASGLAISLLRGLGTIHNIEHLDEVITAFRDLHKLVEKSGSDILFIAIRHLISCLSTRLQLFNRTEDLQEMMELYAKVVTHKRSRAPERFRLSCKWASLARDRKHPTTPTAYENALSLMQDTLAFAPTLEAQHSRLVTDRDSYEKLPLEYASFQVDTGKPEQAIETLERGRALLWSEIRGFRTSIDRLEAADPCLAKTFGNINRELERLTTSSVPPGGNVQTESVGPEEMDPFGWHVVQQRSLLERREKLISQIQALPGFQDFLKAPSFESLRSAASHGPVIIINHDKRRSDILILLHDSRPSLITTPDDFYDRAVEMKRRLVDTIKKNRLESTQYQRALRYVLKTLYDLVGQPVIEELHKLDIPSQSRIWWCPTSAFCSLPLHAMGPLTLPDGAKGYFSDLYISSYTPTLSALIASRKTSGPVLEKPPILVAKPDESLPDALEEIQVIQRLDTKVTALMLNEATPSRVMHGLEDHRFSHFACHGILKPGKPFDAAFELYGGRLTLLDIVRRLLPTADFAFLSACHTAEMTDGSIADEALHLTAAMQYCGFRSVVGTMWAMADTDGPVLTKHFYESMFSSEEPGVPYYERSAKALRDAVQKLRKSKELPLERWVNFVHYGA
ncbi:CHAT domain-containing protein [Lactifluus volemus]|nr:CHAT domain-containing protein [Lactifluus volemus]